VSRRGGGSDPGAGRGAVGGPRPGLRNSVRIVGGARRSRRLRVPPGPEVRPTSEIVREAIFDSLGPIVDLTVLDLFAGTGAMGLEALSRGAARCVFVERDRAVAETLRTNIRDLEYEAKSRVVVADYHAALQEFARTGETFDLLFVDPPYKLLTEAEVTLEPVVPSLIREGGVVVLESGKASHPTLGAVPVFDRVYGDTRVTMVARSLTRRNIP
jgi:16S rRNA (guanine966-N2)-methyltransferase